MDESSHCEPTKSSSTGQVQLTAEKSTTQSSHSEDGLSTAACDEHDETCDMTEEPMSEGESEKMQHTSAESGDDTDPDYIPMSDGDLSCDLQSDRDSSDESIHSCSSTRTDEKPPLTLKKKARLQSTSSKDERTKKSPGAAVLATSNSKKHRVYDKRNYCLFCSKPLAKMSRHLERVHSDKIEVAVAFQYPVNSKERHKIWSKLINQGNFVHNKQVMKTGKGQLVVRKRSYITGEAKDFLHCLYCRGLYLKKNLYRHIRLCPEKAKTENESQIGRKRIASRCALETLGDLGVSEGFRTVLCEMIYDDITQTVMDDKIILQFGEHMYIQQGSDARKHEYIRQNVRQIARLVLEAQKITPLNNLQDFFNPSGFQHAVSAVKVLAGYNPEKKTFSIPSLALKLGYHLQKACSIVEDNAVKSGDESLAESARNFLSLYQKKWNEHISSGALTSLKETKVITAKKVPFAQDVKCLNFHLEKAHVLAEKKLRDNPSVETYAVLAKVILARTIIFNRRKPGEVSAIKLKSFMQRKMSNVLDGMDISVSDLERAMCRLFARVDIRGSCGRLVPVILKPSFVSAMELLVEVRETCGIPSKNPFLFARPSALTPYKGSECVQHYVRECGAQSPEALTSRKIRKHYATMLQMLNLDEEEANQILGPNNQVHTLQQINDMQMDGVQINSEVKLQQAASWRHTEVSGSRCQQDFIQQQHGVTAATNSIVSLNSVNSNSKGSQNKGKQKWVGAEVHAVERHMMRFIRGHKVPQKNDCIQCLEAEPKALRARSWKGVKDYVRNRITALKRQSGTSTNLNRPGQAEPQKSAERFQQL
ncbi:uncharacterized protein LOC115048523 isoform X2 [Echeneis naucrates]|nr:uncharacterized protein LOC115048523 isoform X2 [Echeneis naucrates]